VENNRPESSNSRKVRYFAALNIFPNMISNEWAGLNAKKGMYSSSYNPDFYDPVSKTYIEVCTSKSNYKEQHQKWRAATKLLRLRTFWWTGYEITRFLRGGGHEVSVRKAETFIYDRAALPALIEEFEYMREIAGKHRRSEISGQIRLLRRGSPTKGGELKDEVFHLHGAWRICFQGIVPTAAWRERGPAEAQLSLLKSGYSIIQQDGTIKHVGAGRPKLTKGQRRRAVTMFWPGQTRPWKAGRNATSGGLPSLGKKR